MSDKTNGEIDKQIAELIMELPQREKWFDFIGFGNSGEPIWLNSKGLKMPMTCPKYSSDVACAFEVVEKLTSKPNTEFMMQYFGGTFVVSFGENCGWGKQSSTSNNLAMAICLAALQVLKREINNDTR